MNHRLRRGVVALALTVTIGALAPASHVDADASTPQAAVTAWASGQTDPLTSTDPMAPHLAKSHAGNSS